MWFNLVIIGIIAIKLVNKYGYNNQGLANFFYKGTERKCLKISDGILPLTSVLSCLSWYKSNQIQGMFQFVYQ